MTETDIPPDILTAILRRSRWRRTCSSQ